MRIIYGNNYAALSGRIFPTHFPTQGLAVGLSYLWLSAKMSLLFV